MVLNEYKEGDLMTVTITGPICRVRGDAIVINAHGVEIPVLASQASQPTLAQKILEWIERTEQEVKQDDDLFTTTVHRAATRLSVLINDIKELCQEEVNKQ